MNSPIIGIALLSAFLFPGLVAAQSFEVASIKPAAVQAGSIGIKFPPGGRFSAMNATVKLLLCTAYDLQDYQVQGGPDWLASAGFDIEAKPPEGSGNLARNQVQKMLQSLLADRFHLILHRETVQRPIYALNVGKGGPRLAPAGSLAGQMGMRMGAIITQNMTLASLAGILRADLKRPIIDQTGLKGEYAIKLEWAPGLGEGEADPTSRPSIFAAIQDQLGLKLESTTGPVEMVVIDQLQRPDGN